MDYITLPLKSIPVYDKKQLVVLGGGPAGVSAAISAARLGINVMLVEKAGFLGGQATGGLVIVLCGLKDSEGFLYKGFCQEVVEYLENNQASKPFYNFIIFEPELLKRYFDNIIEENNVSLLLNSYVVDTLVENNSVKYVICETKSGRIAIETDFIIDCTGDADSLVWTEEKFEQASKQDARAVTSCFRVGGVNVDSVNAYIKDYKEEFIKLIAKNGLDFNPVHWASTVSPGIVWFDIGHVHPIDITDVNDLTKGEIEARRLNWKIFDLYKNNVPGFEDSFIIDMAPLLGVRDSRRLLAKHQITSADYGKNFDDCIALAPYYFAEKGIGQLQIPYRSLLPEKIKNLLVAGRAISIEHKLIDCIREIPCCFATGQAAGVAASLSIKQKVHNYQVDIKKLREYLLAQNAQI